MTGQISPNTWNKLKMNIVANSLLLLEKENYNDKQKILKSVYNDFEIQNSWQTYTSLLFDKLSLAEQQDIKIINDATLKKKA